MPKITKRFIESLTPDAEKPAYIGTLSSKGLGLLYCPAEGELTAYNIETYSEKTL